MKVDKESHRDFTRQIFFFLNYFFKKIAKKGHYQEDGIV